MTARARDVAIGAAVAVVAIVVWKLRLFDSATVPMSPDIGARDFYLQIFPMSHRAAAWIRQGILPLWNPYQFAGHPFLATALYGVLYPLNAFHLFLPTAAAIEAVIATHIAIAGVSTYAFGRAIGLSPQAAVTAAGGYMLSGFVLFEASWFVAAGSATAWLPLALLAVERIVARRTIGWAFVLALAVAMPYLAGYPQTWVYTVYATGAYTVVRLAPLAASRVTRRTAIGAATLIGVGIVAGVALCAVQLLPSLELQRLGPRQAGGLTRAQLLPFGDFPVDRFVAQALDASPGVPRPPYVGIAPFVLMALGVLIGRGLGARAALFAVLAVFAVGVALSTWMLDVYLTLPALGWFRGPTRVLFVYAFAAVMLSGLGVEVLVRGERRRASIVAAALACATLGFVVWRFGAPFPALSRTYLAAAIVLIVIAAASSGIVRQMSTVLLALLVVWDVGHAARNEWMHPAHNPEWFDRQEALFDYVREHQGFDRTYIFPPQVPGFVAAGLPLSVAAMPKQGTLREIYSITDYEPLCLARFVSLYDELSPPQHRRASNLVPNGGMRADARRPTFALLDLLSVRFAAVPVLDVENLIGLRNRSAQWRQVPLSTPGYMLYERTDVLPRAYVALTADHVASEADAFAAIRAPGFDPRRRVVLEDGAPPPAAPAGEAPPIVPATIVRYEPARVVVESDAPAAGHLVLTDTFYPGWRATVDGETAPIVQANYLFRAVAVPAGRHTVVFEYAPATFRIGALVTAMTAVAMGGATLVASRRRRRRRASAPSSLPPF